MHCCSGDRLDGLRSRWETDALHLANIVIHLSTCILAAHDRGPVEVISIALQHQPAFHKNLKGEHDAKLRLASPSFACHSWAVDFLDAVLGPGEYPNSVARKDQIGA